MDTRTVGGLRVVIPDVDPADLDPVTEPPDDDLVDVRADGAVWPELELRGARFWGSLFTGVDLSGVVWRNGGLANCRLERVDLSGARFTGTTIERCELVGCRLTGVAFGDVSLKNVVFEDCRFDYANLNEVRVSGPTVFSGGTFGRAVLTACRLGGAVFTGCRFEETELHDCDLRGTNLTGTDLSGLTGLTSLTGAVLDPDQLVDLATIAVRDLGITVKEPS